MSLNNSIDFDRLIQLTGLETLSSRKLFDDREEKQDTYTLHIPHAPKVSSILLAKYPKLDIEVIKLDSGRIKIMRYYEECIPSSASLDLQSLNNKYSKLVHSAVVKKLRPYFCEGSGMYRFDCGFDNLPEDLLTELLAHLEYAEKKEPSN